MIRLGLRLAVTGGREAVIRLALIGVAVAIGVGLLLCALAGVNAVQSQNYRYGWLNSSVTEAATGPQAKDPVGWVVRPDYVRGHAMARVDVAVTGPDSPVPPGMTRLPAAGEFYASPALAKLLATTPADELAERWPGRLAGVLGSAALPSPETLIVVVGHTPEDLARIPGVVQITRMVSVDPSDCDGCFVGIGSDGLVLILSVVAAALLFPLLMFIGTATRLSAARREQRFAAMRLVGATPRQISLLAAVESTAAAAAGTLLGFALFLAVRPALTDLTFTGERFFGADLSLTLVQILAIAVGVPLGAAVAARLALRRVRISPFGVTRRVTPKPPSPWRLLVVVVGLAELGWFVGNRPDTTNGQVYGYLSGIFAVMIGLVVAGPYLTMLGSRLLARHARRPATLIAGRRLADDPRGGFRAVSGLMLALFVTTVATGVITSITQHDTAGEGRTASFDALTLTSWPDERVPGQAPLDVSVLPRLRAIDGVEQAVAVRYDRTDVMGEPPGVISCADLARVPASGGCPAGAEVVRVWSDLSGPDGYDGPVRSSLTAHDLDTKPVLSFVITTDGDVAATERARTALQALYPGDRPAFTMSEWRADFARTLVQFQRLADVVIIASLLIAGCSLAVTITGGLNERKRPFSLLRLTGVRLSELRRVVTLESTVPLLTVSIVAIAAGLTAAHLFLQAQLSYGLYAPGPAYYVIVVLGLVASLGLIASTMPLLRRITGPETARNE